MTAARLGYGTKLKLGDGASPEVFAEIAEIKTVDHNESAQSIDVTNHQSSGSHVEKIGGLKDGQTSFTVNYLPTHATHSLAAGLRSMIGLTKNFRLEEPGNSTGQQFSALIVECGISYPVDNVMEMQITLERSSPYTTYAVS